MKTLARIALVLSLLLNFCSKNTFADTPRGGLTIDIHLYQFPGGYYYFPYLVTNSTAPGYPDGTYQLLTPNYPAAGSQMLYNANSSGVFLQGGSGGVFPDLASVITDMTNAPWSLWVTNGGVGTLYTFNATFVGDTNGLFSDPAIAIFPKDISEPGGDIDNTNQPTFTWSGPTNWTGSLHVEADSEDNNGNWFYKADAHLPTDTTSWPCPVVLPDGTNSFSFQYVNTNVTLFTSTTPIDGSSNELCHWETTSAIETSSGAKFRVGALPPTVSGPQHTLMADYHFEDTNSVGSDASDNGNHIYCGSQWGTNHMFTVNSEVGGGAMEFFGGSALTPCDKPLEDLTNILQGSFSISMWVNTTTLVGNDDDELTDFSGQAVIYLDHNDHSAIPFGLTGTKGAFSTGTPGGSLDTLHTTQDIATGNFVHIVVTRNMDTGEKKIYVNGQLDASSYGANGLLGSATELYIGGWVFNSYTGLLDELQFYAGVLDTNDVAFLYQNPGAEVANLRGTDLQAHYNFDQGRVDAVDVSKAGNDINLADFYFEGPPTITSAAISGSGAAEFVDGGFLSPSTNLTATLSRDFTVSLWVKTTQSLGEVDDYAFYGAGVVSAKMNQSLPDVVPVALTGGRVAFNTSDGFFDETLNSTISVNDGQWHHIAVTRNKSTGLKQIFIDGEPNTSSYGTQEVFSDPVRIAIGTLANAGNADAYGPEYEGYNGYVGSLDDIQFYERDLSDSEIGFLYHNPGSTISTGTTSGPDFNAALNTTGLTWSTRGTTPWIIQSDVTRDGLATKAGEIGAGDTSTISTTVAGPGTLSFYWKTETIDYGYSLSFELDGNEFDSLYGNSDWQRESLTLTPGLHQLTWTAKDGFLTDFGPRKPRSGAQPSAAYLDQVTISPEYPPLITFDGTDTNVEAGSVAMMQVGVIGNPTPTFTWFKNNVKFPGPTNSTLVFSNAQLSDSGFYYLLASNSLGTARSGLHRINVYQPTDLIPLSLTLPPVVSSDAYIPVVWTVTNTGPGAVSNISDRFDFSVPVVTHDFIQQTWTSYFVTNFTPGGSTYTVSNMVRFANIPGGTYQIVLNVDSFGQVIETNETNNAFTNATFTVINPDLQPGEFHIAATNIAGGVSSFTYNITNNGPGDVGGAWSWSDELYISTNSVLDDNAIAIRQINPPLNIAAGQFLSVTSGVVMPLIPSGNYYLHLKVDNFGFQTTGNIIETDESNNIVTLPIRLIGSDLVPTNITANAAASCAEPLSVQWSIENQGDGVATNFNAFAPYQWYDKVYLSTNPASLNGAIQLGTSQGGFYFGDTYGWPTALQPGKSMVTSHTVVIPDIDAGNYYLVLTTDTQNDVKELNETNNLFATPITIQNADLQPIAFTAPPSANAHAQIDVVWNVANVGSGTAWPRFQGYYGSTWTDRIYVSTKSNYDGTATLLAEVDRTNSLAAGTNYVTTNSVTLPGLASGTYYLIVKTDGRSEVHESNETNNEFSVTIAVDSPDLAATGLIVPASVSSQQPFSPVYSVQNLSSVIAFPTWADRLYLSTDAAFDTNDIAMANEHGIDFLHPVPLNPGGSYTNLINTGVPGVPAGDYYVLVQADSGKFFNEPNFANNVMAQPVHVSNPDLVVTNFTSPSSVTVTQLSQTIDLDWSVYNRDVGTAYPYWNDYVYISRTNVLDTNAIYLGGGQGFQNVAPGGSYVGFSRVTLPNFIQGQYYLIVAVNGNHDLFEATYTNNLIVKPLNIVIPPLPVMSLVNVAAPSEAWSGQQVEISWVLTNAGNAAITHPFTDNVFLSTSANGANEQFYGSFPFSGQILPGESVTRKQVISLPINLSGTFWVKVRNDVNNEIFQFTYRTNDVLVSSQPMVVHLTPVPNLTIASIQSPTNAFSGAPVKVSWVETNSGAGPTRTPYWYDAVYLSASTNFNDPQYFQFLGYVPNAAFLDAGDNYANNLTVGLPRGIDGTYYFLVKADWQNQVFETNKTDNAVASGPITVHLTPPPDLRAGGINPPHNAFSGQPIAISWGVTNFGLGQMQPSETEWWDRVYICSNNFLNSSAIEVATFRHIGQLAPDAGYSVKTNVTLPVGVSGDQYVIVVSDIFNQVYEGAFEGNNEGVAPFATQITLTPPPDLDATITFAPTNALASHALTVNFSVSNKGATATPNASWVDVLFVCSTNVFNPNKIINSASLGHYGALEPGDSYSRSISVGLPDQLTGTNYVFLFSDYYSQVFEVNKTNNMATNAPVIVQSRPADLVVSAFESPKTANVAGAMSVSWTVLNNGTGDSAVNYWYDRLILTQNPLPGSPSDVRLLDSTHNGVLDSKASYSVQNQIVGIPASVAPGTYNLFVVTDVNDNVYEGTNNGNNLYGPVQITITPHSADLVVTNISAPTSAFSGTTVQVSFTVRNIGDLPPNYNYWLDTIYLTGDGNVTPITPLLTYASNPKTLQPGESYDRTLNVTLPGNANGDYYFVVLADGFNYVSEAGAENNNMVVVTPPIHITPSPAPDLVVTDIVAPTRAYEGQPLTFTYVVKNVGSVAANGNWIDVGYLSLDQVFDPRTDIYLGFSNRVSNLNVGQSYTNTATFVVPQGLAGPFELFVGTDFRQEINENGATQNNSAHKAIQIDLLPPVDLVAGLITIPVNGSPGHNATITYTVSNQGQNAALGSWEDSLYISADTNWDVSDQLFARVAHSGDLQPGQTYTNTATAPLPGVVPGNYYVIVRSDILNHLIEDNKTNNIGASLDSVQLDIQSLTMGVADSGSLASGQTGYYKFTATAGDTVHIKLDTGATIANNEMFLKFGTVPDSSDFDFAANVPFTANPEMFVPIPQTGTYYLQIYSQYMPVLGPYSILAEVLPFSVASVQPPYANNHGQTTFKVQGALFDTTTVFRLHGASNDITPNSILVENPTLAYVTFGFAGAADGPYDMQAFMVTGQTNPVMVTLSNAVSVFEGIGPVADVAIDGPLEVSIATGRYLASILYGNSGDADLISPLIIVEGNGGTQIGLSRDQMRTNAIHLVGRSLLGPPNIIRPQVSDSVQIFDGAPFAVNAFAVTTADSTAITDNDWLAIETSIRPSGIPDNLWTSFWAKIRNRVGATWGDYAKFVNSISVQFLAEKRDVRDMIGLIYTNQPGFQASSVVSGIVLGSVDNDPQPDVEVDLYTVATNQNLPKLVAVSKTGYDGQFAFGNIAAGQYHYSIQANGSSYFDMNQDGAADTNAPTVSLSGTADVPGQTLYVYQPKAIATVTNDAQPTLTLDSQGLLHAFWFRNNQLWHAQNQGGTWANAGMLSSNVFDNYAVASSANLIDGASPGIIAVWGRASSNRTELVYSVGRTSSGNFEWSQPTLIANDTVQNSSPAVAVRNDGLAVITYLKRGRKITDDTDVYYSVVNVASGELLWNDLAPRSVMHPAGFTGGVDTNSITLSYDVSKKVEIGSQYEAGWKMKLDAKGSVGQCTAGISGTFGGEVSFTCPNEGLTFSASGTEAVNFQINPDKCAFEFKDMNVSFTGGVRATLNNAMQQILQAIPHPVPKAIGASTAKMTDWLRARGVLLQNSVSVGVGVALNGIAWTQEPAPWLEFRKPDDGGRAFVIADLGITISARGLGKNEEVVSEVFLDDSTASGIRSESTITVDTNSAGSYLGASGDAKVTLTIQVYPEPQIQNVSYAGTVKVTWAPYWSYTLPLGSQGNIIGSTSKKPHSPGLSDPLPAGWVFQYDPTQFVGSTNVYGTNSVLHNVGADIYQDGAPALATDASGTPYQVWYKMGNPHDTNSGSQVYVADFNGNDWNDPVTIPNSHGMNSYVSAMTDSAGHRMAVWVHTDTSTMTTNFTYTQFENLRATAEVVYSTFDGTAWSAPVVVAPTAGVDGDVQLSRSSDGTVLATWIYTDVNGTAHVVSSSWSGSSWSSMTEIVSGSLNSPTAQQVAGTTYLVWAQVTSSNGYTALFQSSNNGSGWSAPVAFNPVTPETPTVREQPVRPRFAIIDGLKALSSITLDRQKVCCKCQNHVVDVKVGPDQGCGYSSVSYDYEHCHKIYTYRACVRRASDPNDIVGPAGFGPDHWVSAFSPLDYTVHFFNDPTVASAPAKIVNITVPLDPNFDARTFRLGQFGFGDFIFDAPKTAFYQTRLDLTASKGFYLDVFAGLDIAHNQAFWIFTTIDPNTGDVPINPDLGFLPPNTNSPNGEAFVTYSIKPGAVATATKVAAQATIVFDNQAPVPTPTYSNTLESDWPTSTVRPLPAATIDPLFNVTWQGTGANNGDGVGSYDIYVSQDGTNYNAWLESTALTEAPFIGVPGQRYYFFSRAHGNSGNVEPTHATADTSIFISTNAAPNVGSTNIVVAPEQLVLVQAQAGDTNGDAFTFTLDSNAPADASITTNGLFAWIPSRAYAETTNVISIFATDSGLPPLAGSNSITVVVGDYVDVTIGSTNVLTSETGNVPIYVSSSSGLTNLSFKLPVPESLLSNFTMTITAPEIGQSSLVDQVTNLSLSFVTKPGQALQSTQQIALLTFTDTASPMSAIVSLLASNIVAFHTNSIAYSNVVANAGSVVLVHTEPVVQATMIGAERFLVVYGRLGTNYELQSTTTLAPPNWQPVLNYTQTDGVLTVPVETGTSQVFYRLQQK